jgi:uncharacterized protein YegP (UPF0339 family)
MKFKIRKARNGEYYYTLVARNGKVLMLSETMKRKWSCKKSIQAIKLFVGSRTRIIDETK